MSIAASLTFGSSSDNVVRLSPNRAATAAHERIQSAAPKPAEKAHTMQRAAHVANDGGDDQRSRSNVQRPRSSADAWHSDLGLWSLDPFRSAATIPTRSSARCFGTFLGEP